MYESELEAWPEFEEEYEYEGEWEGELEGELEGEEFFRRLAGLARQAVQSPALRRVALHTARTALRSGLGPQVGGLVSGLLPQSEFEGEFEWESEGEVNPPGRVYADALMEHLGHAAAEAESEEEAVEAFLPLIPLVAAKLLPLAAKALPIAAKVLPKAASTVMRVAPQLTRGVSGIARTLFRSPVTRPLIRAVPNIARRTAANIAQQAAQGRPVTPQTAVRTLARQTARVLSSPQQCVQAYRRSRALDRQFHRAPSAPAARPAVTG